MTAKLTQAIRREIEIDGVPHTVTITPDGVRVTRKRFRSGRAMSWRVFLERGDDELERGSGARGAP